MYLSAFGLVLRQSLQAALSIATSMKSSAVLCAAHDVRNNFGPFVGDWNLRHHGAHRYAAQK
jgi:hypothetical protein